MKLAIAQINAQLADIDSISQRIISQAHLAHDRGANVICSPAPLFTGVIPGQILSDPQFQSDLLHALGNISCALQSIDMVGLIPAAVDYSASSLYEVFLLKDGRVIPLRLLSAKDRDGGPQGLWSPPVFEILGSRIAVTFDALRDLPLLPAGCDTVIHFPIDAFSYSDSQYWGVLGLPDSRLSELVRTAGVWFAEVCPVGAFDSALYIGGSYLLDDSGELINSAPLFEESLLCEDIKRGRAAHVDNSEAVFGMHSRWDILWGALRLYVQDEFSSRSEELVSVLLDGSVVSQLTAALAVDALGPRKVVAVIRAHDGSITPQELDEELVRVRSCREHARLLGIRVIEAGDQSGALEHVESSPLVEQNRDLQSFIATAEAIDAIPILSHTKTHLALACGSLGPNAFGAILPFGDVTLSALENLAYDRLGAHDASARKSYRSSLERSFETLVMRACRDMPIQFDDCARVASLLGSLGLIRADEVIRTHVERGRCLEQLVEHGFPRDATAIILMLIRRGERYRRGMPLVPVVSDRAFMERIWPMQLAWTDAGEQHGESVDIERVVARELERSRDKAEEMGDKARSEIMGLIGGMLGIDPNQLEELAKGEGQQHIALNAEDLERRLANGMGGGVSMGDVMMTQSGFPFFSKN